MEFPLLNRCTTPIHIKARISTSDPLYHLSILLFLTTRRSHLHACSLQLLLFCFFFSQQCSVDCDHSSGQMIQCWEELGCVTYRTVCTVHKFHSGVISLQVHLGRRLPPVKPAAGQIIQIWQRQTPSMFFTSPQIWLRFLWKASIMHLYLSDFARKVEMHDSPPEPAGLPCTVANVRALLLLLLRRKTMSWDEDGCCSRASQDITLDVSAPSASQPPAWLATLTIQQVKHLPILSNRRLLMPHSPPKPLFHPSVSPSWLLLFIWALII